MFLSVRCSVTFTQLQQNEMYQVQDKPKKACLSPVLNFLLFTCAGTSGSAALSVLCMKSQLSFESQLPAGSNQI